MSLAVNRRHRLAACAVSGVLLGTVLAVLPVASRPVATVAPFLPLFTMAVIATEGLTAFLLWTQFMITRAAFLAALAGAYVYTASTVAVQLLAFPGVFSPTGLLGASPQSAVWIWAFWHGGSPLLVVVALWARWRYPVPLTAQGAAARIGSALLLGPLLLSLLLCYVAIRHADWFPSLVEGGSYQRRLHSPSGIGLALLSAAAFVCLVATTRLRTMLDLWLGVAMLAGLGDIVVTLAANSRFSVGWYVARVASVMASSTVLGVLIWEISHLYRELHKANARLSEFASRDGLTGLYNRRYFDERYPEALTRAQAAPYPLTVMMVDIDHFKRFNDTLGHLHGDDTLTAVAAVLQASLRRSGDFIARYGGEEFVVVLPDCGAQLASQLAERLRVAVVQRGVPAPFTPAGRVTVSVGVATTRASQAATPEVLLAQADAALYRAKEAGRNRVAA
ncbi:GGDEF domain-containing protein [Paraburkholderia sp. D15]|uniref:sensor domain-containing diguanylate cyclase n=1 Tax=Paraburkholderia sp. D15 TaxID=2880218 RepID=UPI00247A1F36|nr:sensor domain-containing diguanylate cyclase [Paraburkholderia sp. D15]WGS53384.1 GGDEF domain-containing protein [Paraburkholderia sp. D15]WKF61168.1 putative diguanylate cyclase DgcT [Paraburkholderia busanensis]